ncbi:peptidoglycan recognition protein 1-like [Vombatus ursinus]|uniref:Peptidoglycan recognition protein 1 n=1 Tax=Vombatus ursinus TaxID=29139 RepID=A0A4X2M3L6_VOMUR|nr:peptidoglycan recognition protein 1-like [Vombatus ursinus]XP_027701852.1 peptidoglycan recognition protein 1-like [Vombatus ursinus]
MVPWLLLLLATLPVLGQDDLKPENILPGCPDIVSRAEWGALPSRCLKPLNLPVDFVVVSHTGGNPCLSPSDCEQQIRNIQVNDVHIQRLCDISYNFLIGEDGLIYEGRGWSTTGDHSDPAWNSISLGISFIGNFRNRPPAPRAIRAIQSLLRCGTVHGVLSSQYMIRPQQNVQIGAPPADALYGELRKLPHYRG